MFKPSRISAAIASLIFGTHWVPAHAGATLYSFGAAVGDTALAACDDCFSPVTFTRKGPAGSTLSLPVYAKSYTGLFVANNGVVSFNGGVSQYTPLAFPISTNPMIAPYWADVDTRGVNGGTVWYRTTQDATFLKSLATDFNSSFLGVQAFNPTFAQVVTWDRVGYYAQKVDKLNTFQLVLASDGMRTYTMFKYPDGGIKWTDGDASRGTYANIGFDAGDGVNFYNAIGSRTSEVLNLPNLSNTVPSRSGVQVYRVDTTTINYTPGVPQQNLTFPSMSWSGVANAATWSSDKITQGVRKADWSNGKEAIFGGTADTVMIAAPIAAQRVTVNTAGYTFTSEDAGTGSLQLSQLVLPTDDTVVNFAGKLVVLTHEDLGGWVAGPNGTLVQGGVLTKGKLVFKDDSVLVARDTGMVKGASLLLKNNSQVQIYTAEATTRASSLSFDNIAGGTGGTLDLQGLNTTLGAIGSVSTGSGVITNSATTASRLNVDFDSETSSFSGLIKNGTAAGAVVALTKSGTGTLELVGANSYTGGTTLAGGKLSLKSAGALGSTGTISFSGGTLQYSAANTTDYSARFSKTNDQHYSIDTNGKDVIFASALTSAGGSLTKTGTGILTLTGDNTYSGETSVTGGVLSVSRNANMGAGTLKIDGATLRNTGDIITSRQINLGTGGATFDTSGGFLTVNNTVAGTGGLAKTGGNILTLTGAQTYSGATTVSDGALKFAANGATPSSIATSSIALGAGTSLYFTDTHTYAGNISGAGKLIHESGGKSTLTGNAIHTGGTTIAGGTLQIGNGGTTGVLSGDVLNNGSLEFNRSDASTYGGTIVGNGSVVKQGSGTLVLSGTQLYTGATNIQNGEIKLNGSAAYSSFNVAAGAALSGNGQVGGLTVAGLLSPGNSPGQMNVGNTTFAGAGSYLWEINSANALAGVGYDLLSVTGQLNITATSSNRFSLTLKSLLPDNSFGVLSGWDASINHTYTLVSTTGGIIGFSADSFNLDTSSFANNIQGGTWAVANQNNNLELRFTAAPVPEPETYAMFLAGLGLLVGAVRRRKLSLRY